MLEHCSSSDRPVESHGNTEQLMLLPEHLLCLFLPLNCVAMLLFMELWKLYLVHVLKK